MIWYYQLVHHDIWDFDMPPHPILVDLNVDGRPVKAVVQLSKQAFAYVFDRVTGKPIWDIEERPVPQTDVEGEWTAKTQPFPTKPPAFDHQGVTADNIIDFTPALKQTALKLLEGYKTGPLFTPPTASTGSSGPKGLIQVPGYSGGANWHSGAADPETGFVYVGSITEPRIVLLTPNASPVPNPGVNNACCDSDYTMGGTAPQLPNGLRLMKPPYGRITAYDMNRGAIAWQIPNGDTPPTIKANLAAAGLTNISPTGSPSQAGLLVTKSLLFGGEGAGGQAIFHAYDKKTGEDVWQAPLPAGPQTGLPMTYMHQGNQYIVLAARGRKVAEPSSWPGPWRLLQPQQAMASAAQALNKISTGSYIRRGGRRPWDPTLCGRNRNLHTRKTISETIDSWAGDPIGMSVGAAHSLSRGKARNSRFI